MSLIDEILLANPQMSPLDVKRTIFFILTMYNSCTVCCFAITALFALYWWFFKNQDKDNYLAVEFVFIVVFSALGLLFTLFMRVLRKHWPVNVFVMIMTFAALAYAAGFVSCTHITLLLNNVIHNKQQKN